MKKIKIFISIWIWKKALVDKVDGVELILICLELIYFWKEFDYVSLISKCVDEL